MGKSLVTGIEIARHSIKAVVLKPNKGTFVLVDYQELPIEAGILPDNHMSNYQKIVKKLKELRKSLPRFSNKVAFSIPDSAVISKVLQIDSDLEGDEVNYAITQAFSHQSPFPVEELHLDYIQLSADDCDSKFSFQVYATKKQLISHQVELLKSAAFQPVVADVQAHAMVHVWQLAARSQIRPNWLLVNLEFEHASIAIDLPNSAPYCKVITLDLCADSSQQSSVELIDKIKRHIQRIASVHGINIGGVWVCGQSSLFETLVNQVPLQLNLECQRLNSLNLLELDQGRKTSPLIEGNYGFALATGIALRGVTWLGANHAA